MASGQRFVAFADGTYAPAEVRVGPLPVSGGSGAGQKFYAFADGTWAPASVQFDASGNPALSGTGVNVKDYGAKGDGTTSDAVAINLAIQAAGVGGLVFFPAGTYIINGTLKANLAQLTLQGTGWGSILKLKNAASFGSGSEGYENVIVASAADVTIRDLAIDGNHANNTSLDTNTPVAINLHGVYGTSAARLKILNCYIHDTRRNAIYIADGCDHYLIQGCKIAGYTSAGVAIDDSPTTGNGAGTDNNGRHGVYIDTATGSQTSASNSSYGQIIGNTIQDWYRGIQCRLPYMIIRGNYLSGSSRTFDCNTIEIYNDVAPYPYNCVVTDNIIKTVWNQGIQLSACDGSVCTDNQIFGIAFDSVTPPSGGSYNMGINVNCPNVMVANNFISSLRRGIYVQTGGTEAIIEGNTIVAGYTDTAQLVVGIYSQARGTMVRGNHLDTNNIQVSGDLSGVEGNTIFMRDAGNGTVGYIAGVYLQGTVTNCRVIGNLINVIKSDGTTSPTAGAGGIRTDAAVRCIFTNNQIRNCGHYGIGIFTSTDCIINNNQIADNGSSGSENYGIWLYGSTRCEARGNDCTESRGSGNRQSLGINVSNSPVNCKVIGNTGTGNTSALISHTDNNSQATGTVCQDNQGHNPVTGSVTGPALAATTVVNTNSTPHDAYVYLSGGTVTNIALGTVNTGLTSGVFFIPVGYSFTVTYSVAPTVTWVAAG